MNTLIIAQKKDDIVNHMRQYRDLFTDDLRMNGKRLKYKIQMDYTHSYVQPDFAGAALSGSPNLIVSNIVAFAEVIAKQPLDVIEFQVIFMYHQTASKVIKRLINALRLLDKDTRWRTLQDRYNKPVLVKRAVMLSCESALDITNTPPYNAYNPLLREYGLNSYLMRRFMGQAFHFEFPLIQHDFPSVISFSTGNPIRGTVVLDPFIFTFRDGAWIIDANGNYQPEPGASDAEVHQGVPTSGKIFTYNWKGEAIATQDIGAGQSVNLITN